MRQFTRREMLANTWYMARRLPAFQRRPSAPRAAVRAYQLDHLRRIVEFAYHNVALYRETYAAAGVHPRDLRTLGDLTHFPTVTKDDVLAAYPDAALARSLDLDRCLISKSSGSTGQVLNVVHRADRLGVQGLALHRIFDMVSQEHHYLPWHRMAYIYTSEFPARSLLRTYPLYFIPTLAPTEEIITRLREIRPQFLACYPSHLRALANELGPQRCRELNLRAISVNSELSTQQERDDLAELFGCGVYDEYSTEEVTRIAAQCRHNGYHVFEDVVYLEVVAPDSDVPLPAGQRGEIVGTYLHNFAMPFIRYRQGDFATLDESHCACGRTFRTLRDIAGRKLDQFVLPSGRVLTSGWLLDASYSFLLDVNADIAAFTLIQESERDVVIEIVPGAGYTAAMSEAVRAKFLDLVAEPLNVDVRLVPAITRSGSGKHHPIVSHVSRSRLRAENHGEYPAGASKQALLP